LKYHAAEEPDTDITEWMGRFTQMPAAVGRNPDLEAEVRVVYAAG